jgi:ryanodine receptor 2
MSYNPKPIDTTGLEYMETKINNMASRIHDSWAAERIMQGWIYGPERCDTNKHHPCLIPFEQLSDDEKKFDLVTARTAIALYLEL